MRGQAGPFPSLVCCPAARSRPPCPSRRRFMLQVDRVVHRHGSCRAPSQNPAPGAAYSPRHHVASHEPHRRGPVPTGPCLEAAGTLGNRHSPTGGPIQRAQGPPAVPPRAAAAGGLSRDGLIPLGPVLAAPAARRSGPDPLWTPGCLVEHQDVAPRQPPGSLCREEPGDVSTPRRTPSRPCGKPGLSVFSDKVRQDHPPAVRRRPTPCCRPRHRVPSAVAGPAGDQAGNKEPAAW